MRHQSGYTLVELLISLSLSVLLFPIVIQLLRFQVKFPDQNTIRQNQLGILQLRRYLSLGIDHEIETDRVCMNFQDEDFCFYQFESNLISTPGTQFFLVDVKDVSFYVEDHWLMLTYTSLNQVYLQYLLYDAKF